MDEYYVRKAQMSDLPEIARVHVECFPDSFSTQLGERLLAQFYAEYLKKYPELFLIASEPAKDGNRIVGFCMGYLYEGYPFHRKFFFHNFFRLGGKGLSLLLKRNPLFLKKIRSCVQKEGNSCRIESRQLAQVPLSARGDLLSICVLASNRGSGCASLLIKAFEERLKAAQKRFCTLSVDSGNPRGIRFYEKCGYQLERRNENTLVYSKEI